MHENLMSKATSVLALLYGVKNAGVAKEDIEYVIDCAEEACGDMNQRGGGNFAKAAAEIAGLVNATGSDTRGFCAGPAHALIEAASLVKAGAYKCVAVTAGGCTAKLGMNGKDHVKKGMPILEDCLGGFCVILSENDGVNPEINLEILGRHTVGTGSAPQNVIGSLTADALARNGLKITDIDKYSPEMQNPDVTVPAGAGDVPLGNYKMIASLAVKNGEIEKKDLATFPAKHGMMGWAPTQGHIPSGVPYIGFAREEIMRGEIKKAIKKYGGKMLESVEVFDIFEDDEKVGVGKKSMAYNLVLRSPEKTLSVEDCDKAVAKILKGLEFDLGVTLRG
jgi:hypothetical protein